MSGSPQHQNIIFCASSSPQQLRWVQSKARIQLAKGAIEKGPSRSNQHTAKLYDAIETTLRRRRAGVKTRRDCISNARLLVDLEEEELVERIIDLDPNQCPPDLRDIGDMVT